MQFFALRRRLLEWILGVGMLVCGPATALATVRLHPTFSDHAVLQQGKPVPIWGTAGDGETVTVEFAGQSVSTVTSQGRWMVTLAPLTTFNQGAELRAIGPQNQAVIQDVVVGEVWICSGQSNMERPMRMTHEPDAAIAASENPNIRLFTITRRRSTTLLTDLDYADHGWTNATPEFVREFSAVGYYFARLLEGTLRDQGVPVGIINCSHTASVAHAWMDENLLRSDLVYSNNIVTGSAAQLANWPAAYSAWEIRRNAALAAGVRFTETAPFQPFLPGELYNGMLSSLMPYAFQGVLWYQGEADAARAGLYRRLFPDMIRNWRQSWGQGDFPFFAVQMPPWDKNRKRDLAVIAAEVGESDWAELREAQNMALSILPNVDIAVTTDVGAKDDVHPLKKQPVGERLARLALSQVYGVSMPSHGPRFESLIVDGTNVVLRFSDVEQGLLTLDGALPSGFTVAGADRGFHAASAQITATNEITLSCPNVSVPVAVRFGWNDYPVVNLANSALLPASPFRTDTWPTSTVWKRFQATELLPFTRIISAVSLNVPEQPLSYSLLRGPAGLAISVSGEVTWTPTEAQGPGTHEVIVRVTDTANPPNTYQAGFFMVANESNSPPAATPLATQTVSELSPLALTLVATDTDLPVQTLNYSLISGPPGLAVSSTGRVTWTPTEIQGPGLYPVAVRVSDNGSPSLSIQTGFSVSVLEVNRAPLLTEVASQTQDELSPLTLALSATDADLPPQSLIYSLVSGPEGLSVSPGGTLLWTPTEAQGPGVYEVAVRATDNGTPALTNTRQFTLTVNEVSDTALRTVWQIGTDNNPAVLPYRPTAEFSSENFRNDLRPGKVTRIPGDPEWNSTNNPAADDDFYFQGVYPPGFNGLQTLLNVPNDEPPAAWERAHTPGDTTNRIHFVLEPAQVSAQSTLRLTLELVSGGSQIGGVVQPGFSDHDLIVRFRNAAGATTTLFSQRVSQTTNLVIPFTASSVGAMAGPNSVEIVRTGPAVSGVSYWIQYDFVRLESQPQGNTPPALATPPNRVIDELVPFAVALAATDSDLPAQTLRYSLVSGPDGLTVSPTGMVAWLPTEDQGPGTYTVAVQVSDNGFPIRSDTKQFMLQVNETADPALRTVWLVGTDNSPAILPYRPTLEFSSENYRNDPPPGKVTRLTGDPELVQTNNPTADDDFYFQGIYQAGFNGLLSPLSVPNDEPALAWERALTHGDRTNRIHFLLGAGQVTTASSLRLSFELVTGGYFVGGVLQNGFADHDIAARFRNANGLITDLFSARISHTTNIVLNFTTASVAASAGPNSIEIVRTGPSLSNTSYFIQFDYLRLESLSGSAPIGGLGFTQPSGSSKGRMPASSSDLEIGASLRHGVVSIQGVDYLTLTYDEPMAPSAGVRYLPEATSDLVHWSDAPVEHLGIQTFHDHRSTTVRDTVPLGTSETRFLRVRPVPVPDGGRSVLETEVY